MAGGSFAGYCRWCQPSPGAKPLSPTARSTAPTPRLFSPDVVLNYGIGERWELVLQGRLAHELLPDSQGPNLVDNGVFLKSVLREGTLQDKSGPSIATEFGL